MHVAFLVRPKLWGRFPKLHRLQSALTEHNHTSSVWDPSTIYLSFTTNTPQAYTQKNTPLTKPDLIYWAMEWKDDTTFEVIQGLESAGFPLYETSRLPWSDKASQARLLAYAGVPIPQTWVVDAEKIHLIPNLTFPLIMKNRFGARGEQVWLVNSVAEILHHTQYLNPPHQTEPFILQQVVYPLGKDIRAFIVNGTVVAAMERTAKSGEFRANFSLNGQAQPTTLTQAETNAVLRAYQAFPGLRHAGVDFIRTPNGPMVLEVNISPGLSGIESVTGINVAQHIVQCMEHIVAQHKTAQ